MGAGIDAEATHFVSRSADVDDAGDHGVFDRGEVIPVLMHRKRGSVFGWLLEEFGVMKDDVFAQNFGSHSEKIVLKKCL